MTSTHDQNTVYDEALRETEDANTGWRNVKLKDCSVSRSNGVKNGIARNDDLQLDRKMHALYRLSLLQKHNSLSNSKRLQCLILSLLPVGIRPSKDCCTARNICTIVDWFHTRFSISNFWNCNKCTYRNISGALRCELCSCLPCNNTCILTEATLEQCLVAREGAAPALTLLFIALLRSCSITCRLVWSLEANYYVPLSSASDSYVHSLMSGSVEVVDVQKGGNTDSDLAWVEVLVLHDDEVYDSGIHGAEKPATKTQRWIHVDPLRKSDDEEPFIDNPASVSHAFFQS